MTSSSVMSPDEMISSFPNSILKEIKGEPNYEDLVTMRDELNENYASVPSELGGGEYGYLGVLLSNSAYETVYTTEFFVPADPVFLIIASGTTSVDSGNLNRVHVESKRVHQKWQNLERALCKIIKMAVPKKYLSAL